MRIEASHGAARAGRIMPMMYVEVVASRQKQNSRICALHVEYAGPDSAIHEGVEDNSLSSGAHKMEETRR